MSGAQERPLRADAARNRARVLDVATEVFTTRGVGVPTEEIARAAGVGVGTLFRHFPTKEALLEAVMVRRLEEMAAVTAQLEARADPAEAFFACFRLVVERSAGKNEFAQALAAAGVDVHASLREPTEEIQTRLAGLLSEAQRAGVVRAELRLPELLALLVGTGAMVEQLSADPAAVERIFEVVFDGVRPR
ncbi:MULTISPECIES: TetR/AcrR family transcriptional regulator [unclassified Streptomyces]|uniref:TetR/AcrR family transcriptional regulator n=1 Tax=unclassified Streptomyces TaxID=2593676 RepID=UPI002252D9C1|nr:MULTISPECIES: TetR/AcrR family transcriptional regulator [unclassified Streptomyces]MCX4524165.1 TetR/AcrR family transcriptional regulator [Streptomyces sp. NBC_01551]MCX4545316.1 TetR/AcrR family transcriptional regulator [Streptomyces sp. NBC_01565]